MFRRSDILQETRSDEPVGVFSRGMLRIPFLEAMVGRKLCRVDARSARRVSAIAGWGLKPSSRKARMFARKHGLPYISIEDAFLRSHGTGDRFPPLSVVVDEDGIYYDSTRPSALENLLNGDESPLEGIGEDVRRAKELILEHRLSKYNHAPDLFPGMLRESDAERVLVIDQTAGDMSVALGGADERTFTAMLEAARRENPRAVVYVKTHPEVTSGRKRGYLSDVGEDEKTAVLREEVNPSGLLAAMDRVYTVSSTLGFEALLAGKPVTCFAMPWYAGWGATDDRLSCPRRKRSRSVDELFAAAYFRYTRYLDPVTCRRGTIFDVIDWLVRQRSISAARPGRLICQGFRKWKAANIRPMLSLDPESVFFVRDTDKAHALCPGEEDALAVWGREIPAGLEKLAAATGARVLCMEDGFIRSVGLGSDLVRPMSLVLDERGIYFDPARPSDLEHMLNTAVFSPEEIAEAEKVRTCIVRYGITKYNTDPLYRPSWEAGKRTVVFVPGQVEDDASIRFGCGKVRTNLALLEAVRRSRPDAFLVYKPHPDVMSGNRRGALELKTTFSLVDHVETELSVVSCLDSCDEVHTMTSLSGFEALLRNRRVVTYGQPFYAGWGLTEDRFGDGPAFSRRQRRLTLNELVAGALCRYPLYWDHDLSGYTTCRAVLYRIRARREVLEASGGLEKLRSGYLRRQARKLSILFRASIGGGFSP